MGNESDQPGNRPSIPSMVEIKASLRSVIKSTVSTCNSALASLEHSSEQVGKPLLATIMNAQQEGKTVARKAVQVYDARHEYGPHIIAVSALFFGSIAGLRRGRLPAFAVGTAFGFATYLVVYEVNLTKFPDILCGKKKEE